MIANEIIKSPNIMVEPKTDTTKNLEVSNDSEPIDSKTAKLIYEVQKWNELSMWWLLNVKNAELEVLDEASDQAWKKYAENKTPEMMKLATDIQEKEKETEKETKKVLDIYNTVKDLSKDAKELAIILGNHVIDLENDVKDQQKDFEEDPKIENSNDIDDAIGITSKLQKETNDKLKELRSLSALIKGDNAGYDEFAKVGDFLAKNEPLTDEEVKQLVLKYINGFGEWYFLENHMFDPEDTKELLKLFTKDELREIYKKYKESDGHYYRDENDEIQFKPYQGFTEEGFQNWLKAIEHPAFEPADIPEDEVESIIPELDTSNFGLRMKLSLFNIKIIEGHDMILKEEENWREIEKLLEELKGLPRLEEFDEPPETKLPETPEVKLPETPEDDSPKYVIDVRIIDGNAYPSFQFVIYPPNDDCDYEYLRSAVSKYNTAYHVDFDETGITYSGGGCGSFGTVSGTILDNNYPITEGQAAFLQEKFGFEDFRDRPYVP